MSIFNGYYDYKADNSAVILKHMESIYKKLCENNSAKIICNMHFSSRGDYTYFCNDVLHALFRYDAVVSVKVLRDAKDIDVSHWKSIVTLYFDNDKTLVYNCDGIYTCEERQKKQIAEIKNCKIVTIKHFAKTFKERLSKFIWRHNIPECIFNDVMDDLIKEYEDE